MVIETKRLYLRQFVEEDFEALYSILSDEATMAYYPAPFSGDKVKTWILKSMDSYRAHGYGLWAVLLKDSDEFIGDCGITLQNIDGNLLPEVGYHISKGRWNKGYATEAARGVMNFAFSVLKLPELFTYTTLDNISSQRVALKNGMRFVKNFHKEVMGNTVEEVLFSLSAREFLSENNNRETINVQNRNADNSNSGNRNAENSYAESSNSNAVNKNSENSNT